ncbi:MAG: tetratricopeptide repeat protein [Pseudoramibacter sp.]
MPISKPLLQNTEAVTIQAFYKRLDEYLGNPEKTELFLSSLESHLLESRSPDDRQLLATVYNEKGSFYRSISRFDDSLRAFQKGREIILDLWGPNCLPYATLLNNMAGTLRLIGENHQAIDMFLQAIKIYHHLNADESYAFASVQNNLSLVYQETGQTKLAIYHLQIALDLIRKMPEHQSQLAVTYGNLCTLYHQIGDDEMARKSLDRALKIYSANKDAKNVHYAAVLNSLGAFLFQSGENKRAIAVFKQAAAYSEKWFGQNLDYATAYHNIYWVCHQLKKWPEALAALQETYRVYRKLFGDDHERTRTIKEKLEFSKRMAES